MTIEFDWQTNASPFFFPVTPFAPDGSVDLDALRSHIASRLPWRPPGIFVACGTGEFSSLSLDEYEQVVAAAVEVAEGAVPVVAGVGYGAQLCLLFLERAQRAGAQAALVFPPYATVADQRGLLAHYSAIARASSLPLILYQRDHVQLHPSTAVELAGLERVAGLKDGTGNLENLQRIVTSVGDRWMYFNGMPTAELSVPAFLGLGIESYSSATFAFLPEVASAFYQSVRSGDVATRDRLLETFYLPLAVIRDRRPGYAVSLIKAGLKARGIDAGSVRPPFTDPSPVDARELGELIEHILRMDLQTPTR